MMINRHNYEEYFILYLDNELNAADRRAVEEFVSQHPDLKEELELLLQFRLVPDEKIEYPSKEELWKGSKPIHAGNLNEWLLLYVDNELPAEERSLLEEYLSVDPNAAKELELLMKTRSVPEQVVFADKASLYRREERRIPVFWMRIAAAVLMAALGLTVFLVISNNRNQRIEPALANNGKGPQQNTVNGKEVSPSSQTEGRSTVKQEEKAVMKDENISPLPSEARPEQNTALLNNNRNNSSNNKNPGTDNKRSVQEPLMVKDQPLALQEEKKTNNLPLPDQNPKVKFDERAIARTEINPEIKDAARNSGNEHVTSRPDQPSDIRTAVYDPSSNNFDEEEGGKKNRHRGIFRKIARTFEKRTNVDATEDNKLLVAGFKINLK